MVLVLHILLSAGLFDETASPIIRETAEFLQAGCYAAVNIFALTTGYLMVNRKIKIKRIVDMWLQVVCYGGISSVLLHLFSPESAIDIKSYIKLLLPVLFNQHWYFSAYFALFFIIPFLNNMILALAKRQAYIFALVCVLLFSVLTTFSNTDPFNVSQGYSFLWITVLYSIGGILKLYEPFTKVKKCWWLSLFMLCWMVLFFSKAIILWLTRHILGIEAYGNLFFTYSSPVVLVMGLSLFFLFRNMTFPKTIQKCLGFGATFSFAIYVIHCNYIYKCTVVDQVKAVLNSNNPFVMVTGVLVVALLTLIACIFIEAFRVQMFRIVGISKLVDRLGDFCDKKLGIYEQ